MLITILQILDLLLSVAFFIMIVHINFQVLNLQQPLVYQIWSGLNRLLEPIYAPVRRILPDTRPLDLAPLAVFILIVIARDIVIPNIARGVI